MAKLIPITDYVRTQEDCISLRDEDRNVLGEKRRFEIITVVRDDKPAEFERDLGLSSQFHQKPLFWGIGMVIDGESRPVPVESVGRLMDAAESYRHKPPFHAADGFMVSDLPAIYQQQQELKQEC